MAGLDWFLGRALSNAEEEAHQIGVVDSLPVVGLDALASAAYGPEAALTLLLPLGAAGLHYAGPILAIIIAILVAVSLSYRQTIAAYPGGGGSYTVARENLGAVAGLWAGAALMLDYVLNVAVGIAAGVGTLVSAVPALLPHTLALCLSVLGVLTIVNLRGVRETARALMLPTYTFVAALGIVIVVGVAKAVAAGGHPTPVVPPPALPAATTAATAWILVKAFANGCTAMTGVEAVSNAVPIFRQPTIPTARRALAVIVAILIFLLAGLGYLTSAYGVGATAPGRPGYQSVLSTLVSAVLGRGVFYDVTIVAIVAVLALSANTSFADFPRLCRILAADRYLPARFGARGRRLVFVWGIVALALLSGALLVAFGGVTDRLIPLFAIGALLAFTLSQAGMVRHWRRRARGRGRRSGLVVNALGATATGATVILVVISKLGEGAWLAVIALPLTVGLLRRVGAYYRRVSALIGTIEPLDPPRIESPIVVLAAGGWSKLMQQGLRFALRLSPDVYVVQVRTETDSIEDLADNWDLLIASRARAASVAQPKLVTLVSSFREFGQPIVTFVKELEAAHPTRDIAVVIPDLVLTRWYEGLLHNNRAALLRRRLRESCGTRVVIIHTGLHLRAEETPSDDPPARP
jgi:amino acid transporter